MKNLNYLMHLILYQIFKIILSIFEKNIEKRICVNKIGNKITFKFKIGYYLELLTPETMKVLGSTKSNIAKEENGENVPFLEISEVVIVHYTIVNNNYQQNSYINLFLINCFANHWIFHLKIVYF